MSAGSRDSGRAAALGCRAHTGWAALVVVAGGVAQPEVICRGRAELGDPGGRVRRNVYQAARGLEPAEAAALVEAAQRIAAEQAAAALERTVRDAADEGAVVRSCAVVVGAFAGARLESILASHALAHAAEGRLYQGALLQSAESHGLGTFAIPKRPIWEQGEAALGVPQDELRHWIDEGDYQAILSGDYPRRVDDGAASMTADAKAGLEAADEYVARVAPLAEIARELGLGGEHAVNKGAAARN